jgi:hypothetical protein
MDTGESTKETVKPLRGECRDAPAEPVVTMLVCFLILHARLRVRLAPGIPCSLSSLRGTLVWKTRTPYEPRERGGVRESPGLDDVNLKAFDGRCGFAVGPGGNKIKTVRIFPLGRLRQPAPPGRIGWRHCNALRPGNLLFDRALCFRERRYERASCQIARCHRSSPSNSLNLCHSEWSAAYSRSLRSGWPADPSRRPSFRQ